MAAIYSQIAALGDRLEACRPVADLRHFFRARDSTHAGKLTEKARVTAYQNGIVIQEDHEIQGPTGIHYEQYKGEVSKGPIVLQGDHDTVQFRNVWILPQEF